MSAYQVWFNGLIFGLIMFGLGFLLGYISNE